MEVLSARDRKAEELLLRAEAAGKVGKPEYVWASLSRLSTSLTRNRRGQSLAREALRTAAGIPPDEHAPDILARFRRLAQ